MQVITNALTHYKTTIFGIVGGFFIALSHGQSWHAAIGGIAVALLGILAKDAGKE